MHHDLMQPHEWESLLRYLAEKRNLKLFQSQLKKVQRMPAMTGGMDTILFQYEERVSHNGYNVVSLISDQFDYADYQQWLLDSFDEAFDNSNGGAVTNNFPTRRGFPVATTPAPAQTKAAATQVEPMLVPQRSIVQTRLAYTPNEVAVIERESRTLLTRGTVRLEGHDYAALVCKCAKKNDPTCQHREYAYATGWDRSLLLDQYRRSETFHAAIPIGMGFTWTVGEFAWEQDAKYLNVRIPGIVDMLADQTAFPTEAAQVRLAPMEGLLRVIRYVEDIVRNTQACGTLIGAPSNFGATQVDKLCRRAHSTTITAKSLAGMSYGNSMREAWIIANSYTLARWRLCMTCRDMSSGNAAVPVF